jgi:DNA-binding transcriptional LysR family regulator
LALVLVRAIVLPPKNCLVGRISIAVTSTLDAAVVALPIDDAGLEVRPLFTGEVFYVSADRRHTRLPVTMETLAERPLILYEATAGVADPTRFQIAARAQAAGVRLRPVIEVESADTALELAAEGLGDTYAPQILRHTLDKRLTMASFDPPLVDNLRDHRPRGRTPVTAGRGLSGPRERLPAGADRIRGAPAGLTTGQTR